MKFIKWAAQIIGILLATYSLYSGNGSERWIGIAIGVAMFLLSSFIKQRHMLLITGAGVIAGGFSLQESWLILLGIYFVIASFVSHRSYTHSILGILFFGLIASRFEASIEIDGVFFTCLAGYISHLIFDMKIFSLLISVGLNYFYLFHQKKYNL